MEKFDLLILSDLSSIAMTDAQMEMIRTYVRDLGGGFCMIGGEHSFGLGGYRGTPIADILPVTMDEPDKAERGNSAVVLVVDKSGSMGSGGGGASK
ncbi:MAG: hypothetical protein IIA41_04255, partial [SAR324 cluster bacterium]|nr:hypothetical protein [SAR324 cluster bacterium]